MLFLLCDNISTKLEQVGCPVRVNYVTKSLISRQTSAQAIGHVGAIGCTVPTAVLAAPTTDLPAPTAVLAAPTTDLTAPTAVLAAPTAVQAAPTRNLQNIKDKHADQK